MNWIPLIHYEDGSRSEVIVNSVKNYIFKENQTKGTQYQTIDKPKLLMLKQNYKRPSWKRS